VGQSRLLPRLYAVFAVGAWPLKVSTAADALPIPQPGAQLVGLATRAVPGGYPPAPLPNIQGVLAD
jgi:hypothetical protein